MTAHSAALDLQIGIRMRLRPPSIMVVAALVSGLIVGAGIEAATAGPDDPEHKVGFTDSEREVAEAYSDAKWEAWLTSTSPDRRPTLEDLGPDGLGSFREINNEHLTDAALWDSAPAGAVATLDDLIRNSPANRTAVDKEVYAHFVLSELESDGAPLGGGSVDTLSTILDTPSRGVTFRHFLEVKLTPGIPEWMDPAGTLTVKVTVPKGGFVAYLGDGKAVLPLNTFMEYDLHTLRAPTESSAYQLSAKVRMPKVRYNAILHDQSSIELTKFGKELGIVPEGASYRALGITSSGFAEPVTYSAAKEVLAKLTDPALFHDQDKLLGTIAKTFDVHGGNGYRVRFTSETLPSGIPGAKRLGITSIRGPDNVLRPDVVLDALHTSGAEETAGVFVHEIMHVIDIDSMGTMGQFSKELGNTFRSNPTELQALLADEDGRLGTYWKSAFAGEKSERLDKILNNTLTDSELTREKPFVEAFAEFGRFRFTDRGAVGANSLLNYFRSLAPNTAEHIAGSLSAHLRLPDACGTATPLALSRAVSGFVCEITSAEDLSEFHKPNLASEGEVAEGSVLDGVEFVTDPERLEGSGKQMLSPLTDTSKVFAGFDAGEGADGVKALASSVEASLASDLRVLERVSTDSATVAKALVGVGKSTGKWSELMPYVAIMATGYALSQDIATGDWADAGFDGVAEALMWIGAAQPALMIFTEPALLVDMAAQYVVDKFRAQNVPAPLMEMWQFEQSIRDYAAWNELPQTLSQLRLQVTEEQLVAATEQVMRQSVIPALQARLVSDEEALSRLRDAYVAEAYIAAVKAAGGAAAGGKWESMQPHLDAVVTTIDEAFEKQVDQRREAYSIGVGEQVQAVADHLGLEWAAGSVVFEHVQAEFDREVALPTVEASEALMSEYSRYQFAPIVYPVGETVVEFRRELVEKKLAAYEAEFTRSFPSPLQVMMPNDLAEYRRLLAGKDPADTVPHPPAWGAAVPGGATREISIHDAGVTLSGAMTVTAPSNTAIVSVRTSLDSPPVISVSATIATIGSAEAPVKFGAAGATVFVQLKTSVATAAGETLSGSFTIDRGETQLSGGRLDVVIRDTIPAVHGFAAPGGVTDELVIHDPRASASGTMTLTAPSGTTFEEVNNNIGATNTISADKKTATVSAASFGSSSATVRAKLRVPKTAPQNKVYVGGRVAVTDDDDVVQASGALTVSTYPVTFSQRVTPSLPVGGIGDAAVRIQNHASQSASGIAFTITAPTNTVFTTGSFAWNQDNNSSGKLTGSLSADAKTITYESNSFQIGPDRSWVDLTVRIKATTSGVGTVSDGAFTITGGRILPTGGSTPLAYAAVLARFPAASGEAGPGKSVELKIYDPMTTVTGTMTLVAPTGAVFTGVTNDVGASVSYSADRTTATIGRSNFGGSAATVWAKITLPSTAVPTITYTGTATVTDNNNTIATGTLGVYTTIDGCITATERTLPISLVVWMFPVELKNNCFARIDARVIFSSGADTGWQTIPSRTSTSAGSETYWSTPYGRYDHYETGNITR